MPDGSLNAYKVWDLPIRWFHWINFVCVVCLAAIGTALLYEDSLGVSVAGKVLLKTTHVWFGYVLALNLIWRFIWAFFGNRYARWSAIWPFRPGCRAAIGSHIGEWASGNVRPYVGHNPIARLMIVLLYVLLLIQVVTGLALAGTDLYYPPFGYWIASWIAAPSVDPVTIVPYVKTGIEPGSWDAMRSWRSIFVTVHYWNFYALLAAIAAHIIAVVLTETIEGGTIVSAMISGKKHFSRQPLDDTRDG